MLSRFHVQDGKLFENELFLDVDFFPHLKILCFLIVKLFLLSATFKLFVYLKKSVLFFVFRLEL